MPKAIDPVQVDAHLFPDEQAPLFCDHGLNAQGVREGGLDLVGLLDRDDSVAALALLASVRAPIGDEMWLRALFLPQLQPPTPGAEVGVTLDQYAPRFGVEGFAGRERSPGVAVPGLQLDVATLSADRRSLAPARTILRHS
jgi:hypothetical protein